MIEDIYGLIGRNQNLFSEDLFDRKKFLDAEVAESSFLVIGGAGSIGRSVTAEIFARNPKKLVVVDLSENNLVEMVRNIRSNLGYMSGDFRTYCLDVGSLEFDHFLLSEKSFDYVLNLSAMKHVRSERDQFTLMRMIKVNILNTNKLLELSKNMECKKFFCVSTDKAANPTNLMGASKRIMELMLRRFSDDLAVSSARFANVAFSDGSLLDGFRKRMEKNQPIAAPSDVRRYFVSEEEAGQLCLLSSLCGEDNEIFFPKLLSEKNEITFSEIAKKYVERAGFEVAMCRSESDARQHAKELIKQKKWPCYFFKSDTTGEKMFEEFYMKGEELDLARFHGVGVVKPNMQLDKDQVDSFLSEIEAIYSSPSYKKSDIVSAMKQLLPELQHEERDHNLDQKM